MSIKQGIRFGLIIATILWVLVYAITAYAKKNAVYRYENHIEVDYHGGGNIPLVMQFFKNNNPAKITGTCASACVVSMLQGCTYKNAIFHLHSAQNQNDHVKRVWNNAIANRFLEKDFAKFADFYRNQKLDGTWTTFSGLEMHQKFNFNLCND